jgi:hypothetical protein
MLPWAEVASSSTLVAGSLARFTLLPLIMAGRHKTATTTMTATRRRTSPSFWQRRPRMQQELELELEKTKMRDTTTLEIVPSLETHDLNPAILPLFDYILCHLSFYIIFPQPTAL